MTRHVLNKVIVVDFEATCWDGPPEPYSEIIEIGICKVINDNGIVIVDIPSNITVRPSASKISQYCTDLTGWTWDELRKDAIPFGSACKKLIKMGLKNCVFGSWGNDQNLLIEQCDRYNSFYPFSQTLNIQMLFSLKYGLSGKIKLMDALDYLNLEPIGKLHSGKDDAHNAARILQVLLRKDNNEAR